VTPKAAKLNESFLRADARTGIVMATTSSHLFSSWRTLSDQLKRRLMMAGSATFAMLSRVAAEYSRAAVAAQRYYELKGSGPIASRLIGARSVPRAIFEEFYRDPAAWVPSGTGGGAKGGTANFGRVCGEPHQEAHSR
jgi:hypothetical protein